MVFNTIIINDIKTKSGLKFDKTTDFSVLSTKIFKATGRTIGITTLKRLFNYIDDNRNTSNYTLNTIAIYLGYDSWIDYSVYRSFCRLKKSAMLQWVILQAENNLVFWSFQT